MTDARGAPRLPPPAQSALVLYRAHEVLTAGGSQGKLVSERRRPGSARSAFQAAQAASTTASWPPASTRWLSQRSRRYSHTRSTGFNSGLYGGGWIRVRFAGTLRSSLTCQPAPSRTSAAWVPAGTARDSSARKVLMAAVETSGSTRATPSPRSGHTAPNRWAEAKPCCRTPRGRTPFWYQTWVRPPFCPILALACPPA